MPEKPEVITVANHLKPKLIGRVFTNCKVYWNNIIAFPSVEDFQNQIKNQKIENITTRGKWLVFLLTDKALLIHLRMEGKFFFRPKDDPRKKHEHVVFTLDTQEEFRFHDVRKFGKMYLVDKENVQQIHPLLHLGYEYDDINLTEDYLYQKLNKKKIPIKTALLDQSIIAGIGNIYDDEILYLSHIHPETPSSALTKKDCKRLIKNTRSVLKKAIEKGGTTIRSFTSSEGVHGLFQNELHVHGKTICPTCHGKIEKIKINGRGTYFCPKCQK